MPKKRIMIIGAFICVSLIFNALFAQTDPDPMRFEAQIDQFRQWDAKNSLPDDFILFVGSSSIRLWKTAEAFSGYKVVNRGFGGAHISDMVYFINDIALKYPAPQCIVFYSGDNDIAGNKSPQQVLGDYKKFVKAVHQKYPSVPFLYIPAKPSLKRWALWPKMKELNDLVKSYSDSLSVLYYADTASPMLASGGKPPADLFIQDGLHLSKKGYSLWNKVVEELLNKICGR